MGTSKGWKKMRAGDVTIEQLATYFQVSNRAEGESPPIRWYEQNIALFVRFLAGRGDSTAIRDVGLQEARGFIIHLQSRTQIHAQNPNAPTQERHLSSHSINRTACALRAFAQSADASRFRRERSGADAQPSVMETGLLSPARCPRCLRRRVP